MSSPPTPHTDTPTSVHITGIGAVTGYGWGVPAMREGLDSGESAVIAHQNLEGWVNTGTAYLSLIDPAGANPKDGPGRFLPALRAAGREAVLDARARGWKPTGEVGVIHAQGLSDADAWSAFYKEGHPKPRVSPKRWVNMMMSTGASNFMTEFDFHGPSFSLFAACASGNSALLMAKLWIDAGLCSDVVILATDLSGTPDNLRGFVDTRVAVTEFPPFDANRPFQEGSKGFVGGEASVALVVSGSPTGSRAIIRGGAATSDGYHAIAIAPDRVQLRRAYTEALTRSGVDADEIVYFNAHGSGTTACDAAEAELFDELFGNAEGIYSLKPLLGHCQTAATAVELVATLCTYETGYISAPPQVSATSVSRLITGRRPIKHGLTLKSGIGMGGQNTAVILGEPATA